MEIYASLPGCIFIIYSWQCTQAELLIAHNPCGVLPAPPQAASLPLIGIAWQNDAGQSVAQHTSAVGCSVLGIWCNVTTAEYPTATAVVTLQQQSDLVDTQLQS